MGGEHRRRKNFQNELDEIVYPWAPRNSMSLNGEKFELHRIGNNLGVEKYSYKDPNGNVIIERGSHDHNLELTSQTMSGLLLPIMVSNAIKPSGNRSPGRNTEILYQTNKRPRRFRICRTSEKT